MKVPVSIVTDLDIPEYERVPQQDASGNIIKKKYNYFKQNITGITLKVNEKANSLISPPHLYVKPHVSKKWTLEWCLLKSESLGNHFKKTVKSVHPEIFKDCDSEESWEKSLAQILLSESIKKTDIAYQLCEKIKKENTLKIGKTDSIYYLASAITHACKND